MDQQDLARLAHAVAVAPRQVTPWLDLARAVARADAAPELEGEVRARAPLAPLLAHEELQDPVLECLALERLEPASGFPWRVRHSPSGVVMAWVPPVEAWVGGAPDAGVELRPWMRVRHGGTYLGEAPLTRQQARGLDLAVEDLPGERPEDALRLAGGLDATALELALEGAGLRLPTSTEREIAARGEDGRPYPWGTEPGLPRPGGFPEGTREDPDDLRAWRPLAEAGRFTAGPYGHRHLSGPLLEPVREGAGLLLMGSDVARRRRALAGERRAWAPGPRAGRAALGAPGKRRATPASSGPDPDGWPRPFEELETPEAWEWEAWRDERGELVEALQRQTSSRHGLHGLPAWTLARTRSTVAPPDDVLYLLPGQHPQVVEVALTWQEADGESGPDWASFEALDDWLRCQERLSGVEWPTR